MVPVSQYLEKFIADVGLKNNEEGVSAVPPRPSRLAVGVARCGILVTAVGLIVVVGLYSL